MDALEFIRDISWQVVILFALLVMLRFQKPISDLISNLRKGSISSKKGEGLSVDLEVDRPTSIPPQVQTLLNVELTQTDETETAMSAEHLTLETKDETVQKTDAWITLFDEAKYRDAREALLEDIEIHESKGEHLGFISWLKSQAALALSKYDYVAGRNELEVLIRNNPEDLVIHSVYIDVLNTAGDVQRINTLINNYSGGRGNKYSLMLRKANFLYDRSDFEEAKKIAEELATQGDDLIVKSRAHFLMGKILKKETPQEAKKWVINAYKISPTNEYLIGEIAEFFSEMNEANLVLFFRKRQLALDMNSSASWGHVGNAYLTLNLYSHAMDAYEKAYELSSGSATWIVANIGNLYNNSRLYSKAIEFLNKALVMKPLDEYATNRLSSALSNKEIDEKKIQEIMGEVKALIAKTES